MNMKPSGIQWIGEMPSEWNTLKLKYLVGVQAGYAFDSSQFSLTSGVPLIRIRDITSGEISTFYTGDYSDEYIVHNGDVLIGMDGDFNVRYWENTDALLNQRCCRIIDKGKINKKYVYYCMPYDLQRINDVTYSTTVKHLSNWAIENISVPVPGFEEQQAIASYLDDRCSKLDEIIAEAEKSIEEYKELKQAVITEAVSKGLDKSVPMKDSGLEWIGDIPASWSLVRIPRILDYRDAYPLGDGDHGMIKTEDYQNDGIPYIRVQNLGWGTDLLLDNVVYISEENNEKIKSSQLKPNDVLFCKTGGTIGKTGMIPEDLPISNTTSHVGKITVDPAYTARYVFYVLSSNVGYRQFWEIACQKTTRPELSISETRQIRLTWPSSREEQDRIVQHLDSVIPEYNTLISEKESLIEDLKSYKKSLIYEVVTGKRRVV